MCQISASRLRSNATTIAVDGQPAHVKIILYSAENDRLTIKTLRLR
jgi:hypothetical protein